jgi:hypothetical protein
MSIDQNSASLIISIGSRAHEPAWRALNAYNTQPNKQSGSYVIGSSLEYSREDRPGGGIVSRRLEDLKKSELPSTTVKGLFSVEQLILQDLEDILERLWKEFRGHAARINRDPDKKGLAHNQVIVIGDAWDTDCSYLLLPTLYILKDLSLVNHDTQLDVILDISNFQESENTPIQEALVYRLIKEIENRIDPNPRFTKDFLLESLGYDMDLMFSDMDFYLFSKHKEDGMFAKDHKELEDILVSFLLSILNPGVRDLFYRSKNEESRRLDRTFFSSFGSAGMLVESENIIDYCKHRLCATTISEGFVLKQSIQRKLVEGIYEKIIANLGEIIEFVQGLIRKPDFELVGTNATDWRLNYTTLDLPYHPPLIDEINSCPFINNVQTVYKQTLDEQLFGEADILSNNARIKLSSVLNDRQQLFLSLLENPELFPNYISNLRFILKHISNILEIRQSHAKKHRDSLPNLDDAIKALNKAQERYQTILDKFPPPPIWFQRIPNGFIKTILRKILSLPSFCLYRQLDLARTQTENALKELISLPYEHILSDFNQSLAEQTLILLKEFEEKVDAASNNLETICLNHKTEEANTLADLVSKGYGNVFLLQPLTQEIIEELYQRHQPELSQMGSELILNKKWILNLVTNYSVDLDAQLADLARNYFAEINNYPLTTYLKQYSSAQAELKTLPLIYQDYTNRVLTLLPYISEVAGTYYTSPKRAALMSADGEDFWNLFIPKQDQEWEHFYSPSKHFASFSQIQHRMSYKGLEHLFLAGIAQWDALSESEKNHYDIIPNSPLDGPNAIAERINETTWRITYNWSFTPSDNKKTYDFTLEIDINPSSYYELVTTPRHNGDWHLYAEKPSNELDQVVSQMAYFHKQGNFSVYDQAQNVLSFVQSFIAYRSDIETTGFMDYPRYPLETLWDRVGDCEDVAILAGAILSRLGYKVALFYYPRHLAFGVEASTTNNNFTLIKDDKYDISYLFGEATSKSKKIGEIPDNYKGLTPEFYRIFENQWK